MDIFRAMISLKWFFGFIITNAVSRKPEYTARPLPLPAHPAIPSHQRLEERGAYAPYRALPSHDDPKAAQQSEAADPYRVA
jgi:hypothetical protein